MSNQAQQYFVAETADGKFVAYTTCAPFFCFVEANEADAIATADRALDFSAHVNPSSVHVKSVSRTVTDLRPAKVIKREPAYAC
jgi:hypothetical protein